MTSAKFKNDTTLTRQGDNYQYIVAFECCINAKERDVVYIEQRGDVATETTASEIKHHSTDGHKISDNHVDFWKTLKNWVENYEVIKTYKFLVLVTTSDIYAKSKLVDWNKLDKNEKFKIITEIKDNKKGVPETISKFVNSVFTFNENYSVNQLLEILERFSISDNQPVIQDKIKEILLHPFFTTIPKNNRKAFFNMLLGHIVSIGRDNPDSWQINIKEFNDFVAYHAKHYCSETQPIPDLYKNATDSVEKYSDFSFVKAMKEIKLDNQIQDAINNYFRTIQTVTYLQDNDPLVQQKLSDYQDLIILPDITLIKEQCKNNIEDEDDEVQILRESKNCYFGAMRMPLKLVEGYNPNHDFFQRGTIHSLVNSSSNDFTWQIKKEE